MLSDRYILSLFSLRTLERAMKQLILLGQFFFSLSLYVFIAIWLADYICKPFFFKNEVFQASPNTTRQLQLKY